MNTKLMVKLVMYSVLLIFFRNKILNTRFYLAILSSGYNSSKQHLWYLLWTVLIYIFNMTLLAWQPYHVYVWDGTQFNVFYGNKKTFVMSYIKTVFTLSCIVGGVALLLSLDIFQRQRQQLISLISKDLKDIFRGPGSQSKERLFTLDELEKYRGIAGSDIYLAILGQVFDVTKGRKHYGPDGTYHFFTGE